MFGLGMGELILIAIVALLFIGPDKLPDAAKALGRGLRDLKRQSRDLKETIERDTDLGDAVRDIRSALRGDLMSVDGPVLRPPAPAPAPRLAAGDSGPKTLTAAATSSGAGAEPEPAEVEEGKPSVRPEPPPVRPSPPGVLAATSAPAEAQNEASEPPLAAENRSQAENRSHD